MSGRSLCVRCGPGGKDKRIMARAMTASVGDHSYLLTCRLNSGLILNLILHFLCYSLYCPIGRYGKDLLDKSYCFDDKYQFFPAPVCIIHIWGFQFGIFSYIFFIRGQMIAGLFFHLVYFWQRCAH